MSSSDDEPEVAEEEVNESLSNVRRTALARRPASLAAPRRAAAVRTDAPPRAAGRGDQVQGCGRDRQPCAPRNSAGPAPFPSHNPTVSTGEPLPPHAACFAACRLADGRRRRSCARRGSIRAVDRVLDAHYRCRR
jgi:hypothetical protein